MGAIYRAVDTKLGRTVALKVVRADRLGSSGGEQVRQRFLREALAMSKVDHRNVVRVLDFGFSGDTPYLAMEYLRGQDLGKLVKASAGPLPIAEVVDVMLERVRGDSRLSRRRHHPSRSEAVQHLPLRR